MIFMMKKYKEEDLQKNAEKFYKRGAEKVLATEDGQYFEATVKGESHAYSYAKGKKVKVFTLEKPKAKKVQPKKGEEKKDETKNNNK